MRLQLSVGLIAGAALAYQVLLMRLLGIVHWQPFAALIISLALLGHGASGTWLALRRDGGPQRLQAEYLACAGAFAVAAPACFALAQRLPFNGLELIWEPRQLLWLAAMFLLLSLPFLFAASCFGLALMSRPQRIGSLYGADLLGAGSGVVLVIALLYALPAQQGLRAVAIAAALGAALAAIDFRRPRLAVALALAGIAVALLWPAGWLAPRPTPFKALPRTLLLPGAQVIAERSSPRGWLAVVDSPQVPLRHVPGLSLTATQEPAPQLGIFVDGDALTVVTRRGDDTAALAYLAQTTAAAPYALLRQPRVLVLGAGGGSEVLQALTLGAAQVVAVEPNPQLVALLRGPLAAYSGGLYDDARVQVQTGDPRSALRANASARYDLIQFPLADSFGGSVAGVQAAAESSLYTVEALAEAYAQLAPGGLLALTRWEKQPPRDSLKLFATAVAMLRAGGSADPGAELALIRGWQTGTLLVRRGAFGADEAARLRAFCARNGFDIAWLAGLQGNDSNRYNRLRVDLLADGARALAGDGAAQYLADYRFDIRPARDDRPYFHNYFRWRTLPELWRLRAQGGAVLLDAGYLLVLAALAQALPLALLLVLLPLLRLRKAATASELGSAGAYFLCLGLGFLFVEIAALSRIGLLLGQPLLAATLVLAVMLVCAGLGSSVSARLRGRHRLACIVVALSLLVLPGLQSLLFGQAAGWPFAARLAVAIAWLAPLAFVMGLPFPLGLSQLAQQRPALLPWAWGVNGCASVLSPLLATLLAIHAGLQAVMLAAALLYFAAAMVRLPVPRLQA